MFAIAPRVVRALALLDQRLGAVELPEEVSGLRLRAGRKALVLADPSEVLVDPERDEVLLVLPGRAPFAGALLALFPARLINQMLSLGVFAAALAYLISGRNFSKVDLSLSSVRPFPPSWITFTTSSLSMLELFGPTIAISVKYVNMYH